MQINFFITILFSFILISSCKNDSKKKKDENKSELVAALPYQCPMDCEDGKTYDEAGSCPVCKMDLKKTGKTMTCSVHEDGNCKCEGEKCACANCKEHGNAVTCSVHEDGNCNCQGEMCACKNCSKHSKKMSCTLHEDGNCKCEGDKCSCANCEEHA